MKNKINSGEYWKSKTNSDYLVLVKYTFLGYVFFQRWSSTAHLKKEKFLEHFEYSHYAPTHQELG
jgi:hypothetical protein